PSPWGAPSERLAQREQVRGGKKSLAEQESNGPPSLAARCRRAVQSSHFAWQFISALYALLGGPELVASVGPSACTKKRRNHEESNNNEHWKVTPKVLEAPCTLPAGVGLGDCGSDCRPKAAHRLHFTT